jgi:hypothetical protein
MYALTLTEWETMSGQCYLTKPADLPIELATKYLLVINVATAKKLELVCLGSWSRALEVIE